MSSKEKVIKLSRRNTEEQNKKVRESCMRRTDNVKGLRESLLASIGLDIFDAKKFPVSDPTFSFKLLKEKVLREATGISTLPQLARAGVQMAFNNAVMAYVDTTYDKWTHAIASDKNTELYAPLHGVSFLQERGTTGKYVESQVAGLDISLENREYGQILSIDQNLLDDDQTGQLAQLASDLAEWTELLKEVLAYGKLSSTGSANYAGLVIPASETKPSYEANYPYATPSAPLKGGAITRPASFGALTQPNIQSAIITLQNQLNLLGIKMVVKPKLLTIGSKFQFDAAVLMQSSLNPSGAASSASAVGGAYSINPIKSILEINVTPFMFNNSGVADGSSTAWYVQDNTKPWFVNQLRDAGSVIMENPESGQSFDRKVSRHRLDIRMNMDFIDPRFNFQGNDGSV
jgi:hypothetical protein